MNYYERHLGDYAKDTGHLSALEHGVYTLLLDRYYSTEAPIPADQAHRVARARTREERAAADAVLQEYFTLVDGAWRNGRAEEEIEKARVRIEAAKTNGRRGGRPRKQNPQETQRVSTGLQSGSENETQQKAYQAPSSIHQAKETAEEQKPKPAPAVAAAAAKPPKSAAVELPDWLSQETWAGFVEMRKRIGHPLTDRAAMLVLREADKLRLQGHDPNAAIDLSTRNGWRDVYAPKPISSQPQLQLQRPPPGSIRQPIAPASAFVDRIPD